MRTRHSIIPLVGLAIAFSCSSAHAQNQSGDTPEFSYSYIEAAYLRRNGGLNAQLIDNGLPSNFSAGDGNGFTVRGSFEVENGVYFFGAFERETADYGISASTGTDTLTGDFDVKYHSGRLGIGYYNRLGANMDVFYQAGVSYSEFRAGTGSVIQASDGVSIPIDLTDESQSGFSGNAEVGIRARLALQLELHGSVFWQGVQRVEKEDADSLKLADDFGAKVAARYNISDTFSIGAEYQRSKIDRFLVVARARF